MVNEREKEKESKGITNSSSHTSRYAQKLDWRRRNLGNGPAKDKLGKALPWPIPCFER